MNHRNKIHPKIHIFHNGKVAEFDYFENFKHFLGRSHARVIIKNYNKRVDGKAPWQLIKEASELKIYEDDDQVWCVFDVDDYLKQNPKKFEEGLKIAKKNHIKLAWSNQCFELWLALHFEQISTAITRSDYPKKLRAYFKEIGIDYEKNSLGLFDKLEERQADAIKRARKNFKNKPSQNPSTAVFLLAEELNKFLTNN